MRRGLRDWWGVYFPSDRKSTRLNSSHTVISYAVFCLKKKNVRNGNTLTTLHLPYLWSAHTGSDALVTLALVAITAPQGHGFLALNGDACVGAILPLGS